MTDLEASYENRLPPRVPLESTQPPAEELVNYNQIVKILKELNKNERVKIFSGGRSHQTREIYYVVVSDPENIARLSSLKKQIQRLSTPIITHHTLRRFEKEEIDFTAEGSIPVPVLLHAATFAFEASQTEAMLRVARILAETSDPKLLEVLQNLIVVIIPMMNPDGREVAIEGWQRNPLTFGSEGGGNMRGAILNRDFTRLAEPETEAVHRIYNEWQPCAAYDPHEDMMFLGINPSWPELCWCPPCAEPYHPYLEKDVINLVSDLSRSIAQEWQDRGFKFLYSPDGKGAFLSLLVPETFSTHFNLHATPTVITETARTPGTNTWKERIEQKVSAALAILKHVSKEPMRFLKARYHIRDKYCRERDSAFIIPTDSIRQRELLAARLLVENLVKHGILVYETEIPYKSYVVPKNQPDRAVLLDLLEVNKWNIWSLTPAYGATVLDLDSLGEDERYGFLEAKLDKVKILPKPKSWIRKLGSSQDAYAVLNTLSGVRLVNEALRADEDVIWTSEGFSIEDKDFPMGTFLLPSTSRIEKIIHNCHIGPVFQLSYPQVRSKKLEPPRIAVYDGIGAQGVKARHRANMEYALNFLGFRYTLVHEHEIEELDNFDVFIVSNGDAYEMMYGTNTRLGWKKPPWAVEVSEGLGDEGISKIKAYLKNGGGFIGVGPGGAALACKEVGGLTRASMIDPSIGEKKHMYGSGKTRVHIKVLNRSHHIMSGMPERFSGYYYSDPLSLTYNDLFFASSGVDNLAIYDGSDSEPWTKMWLNPDIFEEGYGAIVHDKVGRGSAALFGIDPVYGARWFSTYRLVSNAIFHLKK